MQPNKTKIALVIGALMLGVSGTSSAATGTFDITVTTVADVELTQVTGLDFGANLFTTAGSTCKMDAATPAEADMNLSTAGANAAAANYGDLSLAGCINGTANGTPGVYKIAGAGGSNVTVTIDPVTTADFTFTPDSNAIANYKAGSPAKDDDTLSHLTPGVGLQLRLPTEVDNTGSTNGTVIKDQMLLTVGGTITVGATDLTPSKAYADVFHVNVVY